MYTDKDGKQYATLTQVVQARRRERKRLTGNADYQPIIVTVENSEEFLRELAEETQAGKAKTEAGGEKAKDDPEGHG